MDIFEVTPKIPALRKGLLTESTGKGSLARVLPEVVPEVAALLEDTLAARVLTFEKELDALSH